MKRSLSTSSALLTLGLLALIQPGCRPFEKKPVLQKLDSLDRLVKMTDESLDIDVEAIQKRRDSITLRLDLIHRVLKDSGDEEHKSALVKLAGIGKDYDKISGTQPLVEYDFNQLRKQVSGLHKEVDAGSISEENFNKQYVSLKPKLQQALDNVKDLDHTAYSIEKDYERTSRIINPWYENLKQRKP